MTARLTNTGRTIKLIKGDKMEEYGKVTLKRRDLVGPFAAAFTTLANDKSLNGKTKIQLLKLKAALKDEGTKLNEMRDHYNGLGDAITDEDKKAFEEFAAEEFTVPFNQIDVMMLIGHLSMNEMEALQPILKGLK